MNEKLAEELLDELYKLTQIEYETGETLTGDQATRYSELAEILHNANVEIPFGIEL